MSDCTFVPPIIQGPCSTEAPVRSSICPSPTGAGSPFISMINGSRGFSGCNGANAANGANGANGVSIPGAPGDDGAPGKPGKKGRTGCAAGIACSQAVFS